MERKENYKYQEGGSSSAECPESTLNPQLDISNRDNATADSNIAYNVTGGSQENACGNCALFDVSQRMKQCMQDGGETTGYCWANQFKCEASAICNKYQEGGPITEDDVSYDIAASYSEEQAPMEEPNMQPPEMIEPAMAMPEMQMAKYGGAVRYLPKASYGNQGRMPYVRRNNTGEHWRKDFAQQWNPANPFLGTSLGDNGFFKTLGSLRNMFGNQKNLKNYEHNKKDYQRNYYNVDEGTDLNEWHVDPDNPENVLNTADYIKKQKELYKNNSYAEKYTDAQGNPAVRFNLQNKGTIPTGANYMGIGDLYNNADWTGLTGNPTDWGWTTEGNNGNMYNTGNPVFTEKEVITTDRRYGGGLPTAQGGNGEIPVGASQEEIDKINEGYKELEALISAGATLIGDGGTWTTEQDWYNNDQKKKKNKRAIKKQAKILQTKLKEWGFLTEEDIDGDWGTTSINALETYYDWHLKQAEKVKLPEGYSYRQDDTRDGDMNDYLKGNKRISREEFIEATDYTPTQFRERHVDIPDFNYGGGLPKAQYFNSETGPTFSLSSNYRPITEGGFTNKMLNTPYQDLEFANYSTKKNTLGVTTPLGNEALSNSNWFPYLNASMSLNDRKTRHGTPGTPNSAGLDVGYAMGDWESKSGLEGDFNFEFQNERELANRNFNTDSRINLGAQYVNDDIEPYIGGDFGINYNIGNPRNPKGSIKGGLDFRAPFKNTKRIDLGESTTGNNMTLGRSRGPDQVGSGAQYIRPYIKGNVPLGKDFDVSARAGWNVSSGSPEFGAGINYNIGNKRNGGALPKAQWWNSFNDQPSNFEIPDYETILSNAGTTGNVTDFGNMSVGGNDDSSNANTDGGFVFNEDPFGIGNDPFNMGDDPLGIRGESTFNNDAPQYEGSDWGDKFLEPGKNRRNYRKNQSGRLDDLTGKEKRQEKRKIKAESWDMDMDDQRDSRFGNAPLNKINSFMNKKGMRRATRAMSDATEVISGIGDIAENRNRIEQYDDWAKNQTDSATISPVSYTKNLGFENKTGDFALDNLVPESYQVKAGGEMQFGGSMYAPKPTCLEKAKQLGLTGSAQLAYIEKCKTEGNPDEVIKNPMYAYGGQPEMAMQQPEMAMQQPGMEEMAMQQPPAQSMQGDELVQEVTKVLQQGADPQTVMEELVQLGVSEEEASQLINSIMQQLQGQGQGQQMQMARYGNMEQVYDVDDNVMEKLIAAGAGIEII